jgi:hypothetical protein
MFGHIYRALNVDEKKLIAQLGEKLRDESFEPTPSVPKYLSLALPKKQL